MTRMTNACRLLAEHIQRMELNEDLYDELHFIRQEFVELLLDSENQKELQSDYFDQLEEQNPWLLELTQRLFN